jgi:hypothetical protein
VTVEAFADLNGVPVATLEMHGLPGGAWFVDVDLEDDVLIADGPATMTIAGTELAGTFKAQGVFGLQRKGRLVAGGGGWDTVIDRQGYSNDAGVKALDVAQDAARLAGETLGGFVPSKERLAAHYARQAGLASHALADAAGSSVWWVDYDGVTHVAPARPTSEALPDLYEVLEFNARTGSGKLGVDGLTVGVGSVISSRLDAPRTIRSFVLRLSARHLTMHVETSTELESLLIGIVEKIMGERLFGKYRYRVVQMAVDGRVDLQAVKVQAGLPDLLRLEQWPGVPGTHSELTPGSIVAVEFLEGDRSLPIVSGYRGKQDGGFVPDLMLLGTGVEGQSAEVAYRGATVSILLPPFAFTGTISGNPATGIMTAVVGQTLGQITIGSAKVKVKTP